MHAIVAAALKQRILVIILAATLMVGGLFAYKTLNIEAYPDPVPPLVDIITQNPGQSSEEIERYITIPIEIQMAGIPNVQAVRTISLFGLSDVKVQFTYDVTYEQAAQYGHQPPVAAAAAAQRRAADAVADQPDRRDLPLPRGRPARLHASPTSRPSRTGSCERRFKAVPGVIDVTGWGGKTKTYDITVDLDRLLAYGLTLKQVLDGLNNANINVGANTVNIGPQSAIVRSVGQIRSMDDIRNTMLTTRDGAPVLVSRRGHRDGRQPAAARHRRPGRRQRHRPGHRADAARRRDPADPDRACWPRSTTSTTPTSCRPACGSSGSTTAAPWSTSPPTPCCTTW